MNPNTILAELKAQLLIVTVVAVDIGRGVVIRMKVRSNMPLCPQALCTPVGL